MGEFTTMHDLFVSCVVPPVERARRAAVFARTARRDHGCRKPFLPCETLNSVPISLSSLRYLSRLSPQAPAHRWQAEALAQEAQVSTSPARNRVGVERSGPVSGPSTHARRFILVFRVLGKKSRWRTRRGAGSRAPTRGTPVPGPRMTTRYICTPSIASELTAPSPPRPVTHQVRARPSARQHQALLPRGCARGALPRRQQEVPRAPPGPR